MALPAKPLRILHVLYKLDIGGLENWLMSVLRHIDRRFYQLDFLVRHPQAGAFDEEAKQLGARVICCPDSPWPWQYSRQFLQLLRQHGPYDVVHSHLALSGLILRLAHRAGVPVRIAHSHTTEAYRLHQAGWARRFNLFWSRRWIHKYATFGLAASLEAGQGWFGPPWEFNHHWRVLFCGIDLTPFQQPVDRLEVRRELGIPPQALVLGHVGRFAPEKNHGFLMEIAAALRQMQTDFRLLLVGDGPQRREIEERVAAANLEANVIFTGFRADLPRILLGAMDVFLFPSRFEGLGLAVVEAQAAGLPCLIADTLPREAQVVPPLIRRLSLRESGAFWAETALAARARDPLPSREEALELVSQSGFNVIHSVRALEGLYGQGRIFD